MSGIGFQLDDEGRIEGETQDILQCRYSRAIAPFLGTVQQPIPAGGPDVADVVRSQGVKCQMMDQRTIAAQPLPLGVPCNGRIERGIVAHHDDPVRRHAYIQFERSHTQREALAKPFDGVFREIGPARRGAYDLNLSRHRSVPDTIAINQHEDRIMDYTALGRTGLHVSVAGLGTGGFSRVGIGQSEDHAVGIIRLAIEPGVNLIDTAAVYGTEGVVGRALKGVARDSVVVCTKASKPVNDPAFTVAQFVDSLDGSLRRLGLDHVDVFQLHAVPPAPMTRMRNEIVPVSAAGESEGENFASSGSPRHRPTIMSR